MIDRICGVTFFVLAVALWVAAGTVEIGFGDVVGPRLFPRMIAVPMGLLSLYLILKPDPDPEWATGGRLAAQAGLVSTLLAYPLLIEPLGFPISTTIATLLLGRLMGAGWLGSVVSGAVIGVGLYLLFDPLLGLPLPLQPTFAF